MRFGTSTVDAALDAWQGDDKTRRLWQRDTSLWSGRDEDQWLGWLDVVGRAPLTELEYVADDVRSHFETVMLLGMGGSSLCPEVLAKTFLGDTQGPEFLVLDSTVPAQVSRFASSCNPARTLFIVASKSGGTAEPNAFMKYFFEQVRRVAAPEHARHFIAITDPGTKLHTHATRAGFRHIVHGEPHIGGRYSALSNFGLLPAAIQGLDIRRFVSRAREMAERCGPGVTAAQNPGVRLGLTLATAAESGRDKLTLVTSPKLQSLGAWVEQLVAESSGKNGTGIVPIDGEQPGPPSAYGQDRFFVYTRLASAADASQDAAVATLEKAGQPVLRLDVQDAHDLGQEFFRWEMATAVACSILGVNAFDQPDVEASKAETRQLLATFEANGVLPSETPLHSEAGISLFADQDNVSALRATRQPRSLRGYLAAHLQRVTLGNYLAINAYLDMNEGNSIALQSLRHVLRDTLQVATTVGYGPRFLHSTGQLHKGGRNSGVFLQLTCDDQPDVAIPEQTATFGVLKCFQAQGDLQVLQARSRRVLRVHLGGQVDTGLHKLEAAVRDALSA